MEFLGYNPLLDSFDIFFYSEHINSFNIDEIVKELKNEDFISEVTYDAPLIFLINLFENFNLAIFGPKGLITFIIKALLGWVDLYKLFQDQIFFLFL